MSVFLSHATQCVTLSLSALRIEFERSGMERSTIVSTLDLVLRAQWRCNISSWRPLRWCQCRLHGVGLARRMAEEAIQELGGVRLAWPKARLNVLHAPLHLQGNVHTSLAKEPCRLRANVKAHLLIGRAVADEGSKGQRGH